MAITSGTKMRIRYKRPGDTDWKLFTNSTSCNWNTNTQMSELIHKDNPGDHSESLPDGHSASSDVAFFHEDNDTYLDLFNARLAEEVITLQIHDGTTGNELIEQNAYITALNRTAQVRQRVTGNIQFTHVGAPTVTVVPA